MTLFQSCSGDPRNAVRGGHLLIGILSRVGAAFRTIHEAIVVAKIRRLQRELMFHAGASENGVRDEDVAKTPRRPLILGDKWEF